MVLRFLMLLVFFIFACSDHERDNAYDLKGKTDHPYKACGKFKYQPDVQECENNVILDKCGSGLYDAEDVNLRCENSVIEKKCGYYDWYDISDTTLRCHSSVLETACGSNWYNASSATTRCLSGVVESNCSSRWFNVNDTTLRCMTGVVQRKCESSWYNSADTTLRCHNHAIETACGSSWYNSADTTLRCKSNAIEELCGKGWFVQADNKRCFLNTVKTKCGSSWYDTLDVNFKCENNVLQGSCGSGWYNVATDFCSAGGETTKYNILTDARDGKTYKTVAIGTQTWMAENLNYEATGECYNGDKAICDIYGRLYSWDVAATVCPAGWRLPSNEDWASLTANIGTDDSGFAPLPGGLGFAGYFVNIDYAGFWWSATPDTDDIAYLQSISFETAGYSYYSSLFNKSSLLSVRCIMGAKL